MEFCGFYVNLLLMMLFLCFKLRCRGGGKGVFEKESSHDQMHLDSIYAFVKTTVEKMLSETDQRVG